ncbi:hypothetical protein DEI96_017945 [Curtobacterium sp. MCLR17_031]|uniref:hypothetical protein n=1 Tax=Curtobacterium sp. MCLR17_031 TaxID=2175622 RepID=UPI0011B572D6|nr:hypothetical protein [Curtobacterium sp. MCLR17_031]WIE58011.1 hypothetical protein DEI96_017945 [Curtobacterium sp. MCLR17_031]
MSSDLEHAWHYTTAQGLLSILQSNRLWASSAAFMNDVDEIQTGRRALRESLSERAEDWQTRQLQLLGVMNDAQPDNLFLLSASSDGDALTLWRSYGMGTEAEYALELDPSVPLAPVVQNMAAEHPSPPPGWGEEIIDYTDDGQPIPGPDPDQPSVWGGTWGRVRYLSEGSTWADEEAERILSRLRKPRPGRITVPFVGDYFTGVDPTVLFKNPGFVDEREVRTTWDVWPRWKFVLYRASRLGITPYIEVGAYEAGSTPVFDEDEPFVAPSRLGRLPIRAVRIGPTRRNESAGRALRQLLDATGYGSVQIFESAAPYR